MLGHCIWDHRAARDCQDGVWSSGEIGGGGALLDACGGGISMVGVARKGLRLIVQISIELQGKRN